VPEPWSIVTWNVNSLRARLGRVEAWVRAHQPDVLCLQETKCADTAFPQGELEGLGYHVAYAGQENGLNGVAILSREPLADVLTELPGHQDDPQRRFISARVGGVRVICVYVPNGQSLGSDAFFYKLDWLSRLVAHLRSAHDPAERLVLLGDFNIAPDDRDLHDPSAWEGGTHVSPHERRSLGFIQAWGLIDAQRHLSDAPGLYTFFDYRATYKEFSAEEGMRIDLVLVTAPLVEHLRAVEVDLVERAGEKPSDHAPVVARFAGAGPGSP
jgi:exodeoxyribonuclease-3